MDAANGNDSNTGADTEHPLKTLNAALDSIADGGTIYIVGAYSDTSAHIYKKSVLIKGSDSSKKSPVKFSERETDFEYIDDGVTVTFQNIDFGTNLVEFTKPTNSTGTGSIVLNNVTASNLTVTDNISGTTIQNSTVAGRLYQQSGTVTLENSTLENTLKCHVFIAKGDVTLKPSASTLIDIEENITVEKPVKIVPQNLRRGEYLVEVPSSASAWAECFALSDTSNGKFTIKCRERRQNSWQLVITEILSYSDENIFCMSGIPMPDETVATGYIGNPSQNKFSITASWSGNTDAVWVEDDIPKLTVKLFTDVGAFGVPTASYCFTNEFDYTSYAKVYNWANTDQMFSNFVGNEDYLVDGVTASVEEGQGVGDDGRSFTFTLTFPKVHKHILTKIPALAPTCVAAGNIEYWECSVCHKYFSDETANSEIQNVVLPIDKNAHDYGRWTSNGNGTHTRICAHDANHSEKGKCTGGLATCTEKATCRICGGKYGEINASNHIKLIKVAAKAATHLKEGNIEYWYCGECDKYFSDEACKETIDPADTVIPILTEHTADGTGWHSDENGHWNTCACGKKLNEDTHHFEWVTDKEATATEAGSKHEECTVCGYKKAAVEIPAIDTTDAQGKPINPDAEADDPQTGDSTNLALWLSLLLASGALATVGVCTRKKEYKK